MRSSRRTSCTMASVSVGVRFGAWSLRRRPSMRTRGGDPTLMCRSDPPTSPRARRKGTTDNGSDPVTWAFSGCHGPTLRAAGDPDPLAGLLEDREDVALLDDVALGDVHRGHDPVTLCEDGDL